MDAEMGQRDVTRRKLEQSENYFTERGCGNGDGTQWNVLENPTVHEAPCTWD